jgi:hypothetical protein
MRRCRPVIALIVLLLALLPLPGEAQDSWLDGTREAWNAAGMAIPAAGSPATGGSEQCQSLVRPVETPEDAAVAEQGWRLYAAYQRGWGITLVGGFLGFDAMCRPVPYQQFVFVDGVFAGTLAPEPMYPRVDGALTDAGIGDADRLYAVYDRYDPDDPLCCPSSETPVTFTVERTPAGPVVNPDLESSAVTPAAQESTAVTADSATYAVCVGLGGDALSLVYWTAEEIAAQEERTGPVVRAHPVTGGCMDPAGLPVLGDRASVANFAWLCSRTFDGDWYGPHWVADIYRSETDVPPDPAIGGCPLPRDQSIPAPPAGQQAAATAVYLSQLEAAGDLDTLYQWLHPDAQAVVPKEAVAGWYDAEWLPRGPEPISVTSVELGDWTWDVTGTTYPNTATITYEQSFADGSLVSDTVRLVQDEQGVWRWFFGRDRAFVDEQIDRFID